MAASGSATARVAITVLMGWFMTNSSLGLGGLFDQLDANFVGAFDKGDLEFATENGARLIGDGDAVLLQTGQRLIDIVDTEPDMVGDVSLRGFELRTVLPQVGPLFLRVLPRKNDEVDVVHHQR